MTHFGIHRPASRRLTIAALPAGALLSIFLATLIVTPAPARAEEAAVKKPILTVEERVHDTGDVARDQVVDHTFKIRNSGDAPLTIERIIVSGNLEVVDRPASLAPGEAGGVHVRVPLLREKALALQKQIELRTNDPQAPALVLELKIRSTEYVLAKPGYARWNSVQFEKPGTIAQRLVAADGQKFAVLRTSTPPAGITASIPERKKEPGSPDEWKLDLTLAADAPVGAIVGDFLVHVDHPKQKVVPIPLSGFMRPVMAATPNALSFGDLTLSTKKSQIFTIQSFSTEPVHVTRVEHDLKGVAPGTVETRKTGREYLVKLEFDPATTPKGALRGTLSIFTDSAKVPVLKVPVDGTIR